LIMLNRQLGRVRIPRDMFFRDPEELAEVLSIVRAVPVRVEFLFQDDVLEYTLMSKVLPEIDEGSQVPRYDMIVDWNEDGWPVAVRFDIEHPVYY